MAHIGKILSLRIVSVGTLLGKGYFGFQGEKKGTQYLLNPKLFEQAKLNITPSFKTIELYILETLIKEDLKYNGASSIRYIKNA